jgi:hypothetical protein
MLRFLRFEQAVSRAIICVSSGLRRRLCNFLQLTTIADLVPVFDAITA